MFQALATTRRQDALELAGWGSVVLDAMGAARILLIKSKLNFTIVALRTRSLPFHFKKLYAGCDVNVPSARV